MTDLSAVLTAIKEKCLAKTVDCPEVFQHNHQLIVKGVSSRADLPCCHGSGAIPDPAYAPLLKLVAEVCPCTEAFLERGWGDNGCGSCYEAKGHRLTHHPSCSWPDGCNCGICIPCMGTGYVTRSWDNVPEGALVGALLAACDVNPEMPDTMALSEIIWSADNPDLAAAQAVEAAL